jgi:hypothetical protein
MAKSPVTTNLSSGEMLEPSRRWYAHHAHRFAPAARRMLLYRGDRRTSDFRQWVVSGVHLNVDPAEWLRETEEREIEAAINGCERQPLRARLRFKGERNRDRRARVEACARCGETSHLEHHHFAPIALTGRLGLPERAAVTLCRVCHKRIEEALKRALPLETAAAEWLREQMQRAQIRHEAEARLADLAWHRLSLIPGIIEAYELAGRRSLLYAPSLGDRSVLRLFWRLVSHGVCRSCGAPEAHRLVTPYDRQSAIRAGAAGEDLASSDRYTVVCDECVERFHAHRKAHPGSREEMWHEWLIKCQKPDPKGGHLWQERPSPQSGF